MENNKLIEKMKQSYVLKLLARQEKEKMDTIVNNPSSSLPELLVARQYGDNAIKYCEQSVNLVNEINEISKTCSQEMVAEYISWMKENFANIILA